MSVTFPTSSGSVENLNDSAFHGFTPYERHARWITDGLTLSRSLSNRLDQYVTPSCFGGGFNVSATIARWSKIPGPRKGRPVSL